MFVVLAIELVNSAVEATVDRIGVERHPLSAIAKELGSAAVFVAFDAARPQLDPGARMAALVCGSLAYDTRDGLPGPLRGPHPAGQDPHAEPVLRRADAAARLRRLRGKHRLQPAPARQPGTCDGHRGPRLRPLSRVDDEERHVAAPRQGARGRVHGPGLHHDGSRLEPAHGLPSGRDDAFVPPGSARRRQHHDRRLRARRARRHDRACDAVCGR